MIPTAYTYKLLYSYTETVYESEGQGFNPGAGQNTSISHEIRATKTSAHQAVKLGPFSWDNVNLH